MAIHEHCHGEKGLSKTFFRTFCRPFLSVFFLTSVLLGLRLSMRLSLQASIARQLDWCGSHSISGAECRPHEEVCFDWEGLLGFVVCSL